MTEIMQEFVAWGQMADLAEATWFDKKRLPTDKEYLDVLVPFGWSDDYMRRLTRNPTYLRMLKERGVSQDVATGDLMPEQLAAIHTYLNIADQRSLRAKLSDLGITSGQFNAWMKYPPFKDYLQKRADELFAEGLPVAHRALMGQVAAGNVRAIKLYYDKFGFGADTQNGNSQDLKVMVMRLIEVIQKHVTDADILKAIARDFEKVVNGETVPLRGEIERGE